MKKGIINLLKNGLIKNFPSLIQEAYLNKMNSMKERKVPYMLIFNTQNLLYYLKHTVWQFLSSL
jgi:hypothetical protein